MIELRINTWEFGELSHNLQALTNVMVREYATEWGLDHDFDYYWLQITPEQFVMANIKYPDVITHFKRIQ